MEEEMAKLSETKAQIEKARNELQSEKASLQESREQASKKNFDPNASQESLLFDMDLSELQRKTLESPRPEKSDVFRPDSNKKENLAVQFIDWVLQSRPHQKIDMLDLKNAKKIGEGAAAHVFKSQYKFTDVAVKQLKVESLIQDQKLSKDFQREVSALVQCTHTSFVMFMGAAIGEKGTPVIVSEFCSGGTLFEVLHERRKSIPQISFKQRHKMALDIAKGVYFMHDLKTPLMHRDLKSLNILLQTPIKTIND